MSSPHTYSAELGEKNVFEEIFELLERHRLNPQYNFSLGNFYDVVHDFDIQFQKFNSDENNKKNWSIFNFLLNHTIRNFLTIFKSKGFKDEPIFYAFKMFISFFALVLKEANLNKRDFDITRNFFENFPSLKIDITNLEEEAQELYLYNYGQELSENQKAIEKFEDLFPFEIGVTGEDRELTIYCNDFIGKKIIWHDESASFQIISEKFYMFLDIVIDTNVISTEKLLTPLWLIISSLEKIDNVAVELDNIAKGSLRATIKIWMKGLLAKEETKAVLETAKEITVKKLSGGEVSYTEVKKSRQEVKKLELENEKLENEIRQSPSNQETELDRALDIQRKMLENEKLQIENAKAKLEVVQQLSELVSKGIVEADMIRIDVNEILYILKEKDEVGQIGPDISEIS